MTPEAKIMMEEKVETDLETGQEEEYRGRSNYRNRSASRDRYYRDDRDSYYRDDRNYRSRDGRYDFKHDSKDYRNYRSDSRSDRKGYWKRTNHTHCAGCGCNQQGHNTQNRQPNRNKPFRSGTPGPDRSDRFQAMTDTLHNLVDDSCNLLKLQEQYTESLNC